MMAPGMLTCWRSVQALVLCAAIFFVLIPAGVSRADEDSRAAAAADFARGIDLANQGLYQAALDQFNAAYAKSPHFAVLYNIAQAEIALERPRDAIAALTQYLHDGGDQVPLGRRELVRVQIDLLESQLADLSIADAQPGTAVRVDDGAVERTPLVQPAAAAPVAPVGVVSSTPFDASDRGERSNGLAVRTTAYLLAGMGVAAAGTALGIYLSNRGRYDDWQRGQAALGGDTPGSAAYRAQATTNNQRAASLTTANHTILGLAIASGALVGAGASLFLINRAARRRARELSVAWRGGASMSLVWSTGW